MRIGTDVLRYVKLLCLSPVVPTFFHTHSILLFMELENKLKLVKLYSVMTEDGLTEYPTLFFGTYANDLQIRYEIFEGLLSYWDNTQIYDVTKKELNYGCVASIQNVHTKHTLYRSFRTHTEAVNFCKEIHLQYNN